MRTAAGSPTPPGGCCTRYLLAPSLSVRLVRFRVTAAAQAVYLFILFMWMGSGATEWFTPAFYALHVSVVALAAIVATQHARDVRTHASSGVRAALYWLCGFAGVSYILHAAHLVAVVLPDLYTCVTGGTGGVCTHNYVFTAYIFLSYNPILLILLVQAVALATCARV